MSRSVWKRILAAYLLRKTRTCLCQESEARCLAEGIPSGLPRCNGSPWPSNASTRPALFTNDIETTTIPFTASNAARRPRRAGGAETSAILLARLPPDRRLPRPGCAHRPHAPRSPPRATGVLAVGQGEELSGAAGRGCLTPKGSPGNLPPEDRAGVRGGPALGPSPPAPSEAVHDALGQFSRDLGIAYQVREPTWKTCWATPRPAMLIPRPAPVGCCGAGARAAKGRRGGTLGNCGGRAAGWTPAAEQVAAIVRGRVGRAGRPRLLETHKEQAVSLAPRLDNANLKGLLRRVLHRIFGDGR